MAAFGSKAFPAACLPCVKTYIEIKGSKDRPLKLADNLLVWQGVVYLDAEGNIFLSDGTSYALDNVEVKATSKGSTKKK